MRKAFFNDEMSLPVAECLEDSPAFGKVPYFLVGDDAHPLQSWLLRPYPGQGIPEEQRIFNYKMSMARAVIENAFGIPPVSEFLCNTYKVLQKKTDRTVKAAIYLHNFLRQTNSAGYCLTGFVDSYDETGTIKEGEWRRLVGHNNGAALLQDIPPVRGSLSTTSVLEVRNMKSYVKTMEGSVPWQWDHVRSRGDILANENS